MFHVAHISVVIFWAKTSVPGLFAAKNRRVLNSTQECALQAPPLVQSALYLILAGYSLDTPELVCSGWLFNRFSRFLANQRPAIVPPYAPHMNAEVRGNPLQSSHPKPRLRPTSDTFVGRAYSNLYRIQPWHRAKRFVGVTFSRSPFTSNVFDLQVLPALIKS